MIKYTKIPLTISFIISEYLSWCLGNTLEMNIFMIAALVSLVYDAYSNRDNLFE